MDEMGRTRANDGTHHSRARARRAGERNYPATANTDSKQRQRKSVYQRSDETNTRGDGAYLGRSRNRNADRFFIVGIEIKVSSLTRARPVK